MPGVTASYARGHSRGHPREAAANRTHLAGSIMWLPAKDELTVDVGIGEGCYKHPVVILSPQTQDRKVVLLIITSFNGRDLSVRHPNDLRARMAHLPIAPCSPHPDNGTLLHLEDATLEMRKKSYVKTETQRSVLFAALQPYDRRGTDFTLSRSSYHILIGYINYYPPVPHPASTTTPSSQIRSSNETDTTIQVPARARQRDAAATHGPRVTQAQRDMDIWQEYIRTHTVPAQTSTRYSQSTNQRPSLRASERQSLLSGSYPSYGSYSSPPRQYRPMNSGIYGGEPEKPFDWHNFVGWAVIALWIVGGSIIIYEACKGVRWALDAITGTVVSLKQGVASVGDKMQVLWSSLANSSASKPVSEKPSLKAVRSLGRFLEYPG